MMNSKCGTNDDRVRQPITAVGSHHGVGARARHTWSLIWLLTWLPTTSASAQDPVERIGPLPNEVLMVFEENCFGCHADGSEEGQFSFDRLLAADDSLDVTEQWFRALKQIRAKRMPPVDEQPLSAADATAIKDWIKHGAFGIDPDDPDPGRVTIRRLNQVEYRNAVRDLLGVDYDTAANFPADDTGEGFDNNGDVLSISPLLLEKYVNAAKEIVSSVVPQVSRVVRVSEFSGSALQIAGAPESSAGMGNDGQQQRSVELSYYQPSTAALAWDTRIPGEYTLRVELVAAETYRDNQFDTNSCDLSIMVDDDELLKRSFVRQGSKRYVLDIPRELSEGSHKLELKVEPTSDSEQIRQLRLRIESIVVEGPHDPEHYVPPTNYGQFFPRSVPEDAEGKRAYAKELLKAFATRAFRRPVDDQTLSRLADLAESVYSNGSSFESGVAKSMTAILASPRFIFREEFAIPDANSRYPLVDEYSLASRLSFFLWSSIPDAQLMELAQQGQLRAQLDAQIERMLADPRSNALAQNFVGQWLRARVVESIPINSSAVLAREPVLVDPEADTRRARFFELFRKGRRRSLEEEREYEGEKQAYLRSFQGGSSKELTDDVRSAMRRESELVFDYILKEDHSLLELLDSDYTFLNEQLWVHYELNDVPRVDGDEMRRIELPEGNMRGGILTQGTMLVVTSNPDRTSPVKRGLFILENLLGAPPPAPPPNVPALEEASADSQKQLSLRETLAIHRENALCSSCHNEMDPLGLALENFNAVGTFRTIDEGQPVDPSGSLGEGQDFTNVQELKNLLVTNRRIDFYRCLTEKMMMYALGRGIEYQDTHTVDAIVDALDDSGGSSRLLLNRIIQSNAFQRLRGDSAESLAAAP